MAFCNSHVVVVCYFVVAVNNIFTTTKLVVGLLHHYYYRRYHCLDCSTTEKDSKRLCLDEDIQETETIEDIVLTKTDVRNNM